MLVDQCLDCHGRSARLGSLLILKVYLDLPHCRRGTIELEAGRTFSLGFPRVIGQERYELERQCSAEER